MKALTTDQPCPTFVALGVQTVIALSWATSYRGPLAVHASGVRPPLQYIPPLSRGRTDADRGHDRQTWMVIDTITDPAFKGPQPANKRIPKRATTPTLFWPHAGPHHRPRADKPEYTHTEHLPLSAVVATCTLVDCVPIHRQGCGCGERGLHVLVGMSHFGEITGLFDADGKGVDHPLWSPSRLDCLAEAHPRQQVRYGDFRCGRWAWLLDDVKPCGPVREKGRKGRLWTWNEEER